MHIWKESYDPKTRSQIHAIKPGFGHSWLSLVVARAFQRLGVSIALWNDTLWSPIYEHPNVVPFELEHGVDTQRDTYNKRMLGEALKRRVLVRGEHAGFSDLFQPVIADGGVIGVLVTGPFQRARPQASEIAARWRRLTGRSGHLSDPEFAAYLQTTLATLVLEGDRAVAFEATLGYLAGLLGGLGPADELATQADLLRVELQRARDVDRMWETARTMVSERSAHVWQSSSGTFGLSELGLVRMPDHVLVGLAVNRESGVDPIEEVVRLDAFQRMCVELARSLRRTISGRVGDHGVVFLCAAGGSARSKAERLAEIAERASATAKRRFGLTLHCGANVISRSMPLSSSFQAALAAAQSALVQGKRLVTSENALPSAGYSLRNVHAELARVAEESPALLQAFYDRYLETVARHSAYKLDAARAHLEVGFERIAGKLLQGGTLNQKSVDKMQSALDSAAAEASNLTELMDAHRRAARDLALAAQLPVKAQHDHNLRRALEHIRTHYSERLTLTKVAKVAGFNPSYFSRLFTKHEGIPFEQYVRTLRIERAKQLLASGSIDVARIAELSGFHSPEYFARVFKSVLGVTPRAYRLERTNAERDIRRVWEKH